MQEIVDWARGTLYQPTYTCVLERIDKRTARAQLDKARFLVDMFTSLFTIE